MGAFDDIPTTQKPAKGSGAFDDLPTAKRSPGYVQIPGLPASSAIANGVIGAADALQHHVLNIPQGIEQVGRQATAAIARGLSTPSLSGQATGRGYAPGSYADNATRLAGQTSQAVADREAAYQARTDGNVGSYGGAVAGEVLPWMVGIGELKAAGLLPQIIGSGVKATAQKAGLLAGEGAAMAAVQPVTDGDYWRQKGAQVATGGIAAPLLYGGVQAIAAPVRWVNRLVDQVSQPGAERRAAQVIAGEAENPASLLLPQPSAVPGVQRSLAEESLDPGVARLERKVRQDGQGWDTAERINNQRRVEHLQQRMGTPDQRPGLVGARSRASSPHLDTAKQVAGVDTTTLLAQVDNLVEQYTGNSQMQGALRKAKAEIEAAGGNMAYLENARQAIGNLINGTADGSMVKLPDLIGAKDALTQTMRGASPDFGAYLDNYIAGSKPINRLDLGEHLYDKASGAVPDAKTGVYTLTPAGFHRQVGDLDRAAQQATGFGRAKAADILEPGDVAAIGNVADDLSRQHFMLTAAGAKGSPTNQLGEVGARIAKQAALQGVPFLNNVMAKLDEFGAKRLQGAMSAIMQNPDRYREITQQLTAPDRSLIEAALRSVAPWVP